MKKSKSGKKIYSYKCKKCGRIIESFNENQTKNNGRIHEMTCKPKKGVGRPKGGKNDK